MRQCAHICLVRKKIKNSNDKPPIKWVQYDEILVFIVFIRIFYYYYYRNVCCILYHV